MIDGHLLNVIPGDVPREWLEENRLQQCTHCGKTVAASAAHGIHRRCWASVQAARDSSRNLAATHQSSAPDINLLLELPPMDEVCGWVQITKEYVEHDVLALAEPEFLRCVANAARFHDKDAFTFIGTDEDTDWRKRCRVAWIELFMFSKTCLPQFP